MKKQISLLMVMMLWFGAVAQPIKFSQFAAKDINTSTYVVGTYDSTPGVPKNGKFKLPITYRQSDNAIKVPSLAKGLMQIGDSGRVSTRTMDSMLFDRYYYVYRRYVSFTTDAAHGSMEVEFGWWIDSLDRSFHISGWLYTANPSAFPDPPARMSIPLISWNSGMSFYWGAQATVVTNFFSADPAMLPMYGGGQYFSTIDIVAEHNPIPITTTIMAQMVKPANTVSEYYALFNITIPR